MTEQDDRQGRFEWEDYSAGLRTSKGGLASKLGLLLLADLVVSFAVMGLAIAGGGNPFGAAMVCVFLLIPAPFLAVGCICAAAYSWWSER